MVGAIHGPGSAGPGSRINGLKLIKQGRTGQFPSVILADFFLDPAGIAAEFGFVPAFPPEIAARHYAAWVKAHPGIFPA